MRITELKTLKQIGAIYDICDTINDETATRKYLNDGKSLRETFINDCKRFLMYLSASDGKISPDEAEFLLNILGEHYSTDNISEEIQRDNLYSAAFENTAPISLKCFVASDNKKASDNRKQASSSELYYRFFETLGKEFISCDDSIVDSEIDDLTIYLTMIRDYINSEGHFPTSLKGKINIKDCLGDEDDESLQDLLNELDALTGLKAVKKDVNSLINLLQIQKLREERGLKPFPVSLHLVFMGNPGTGKTTVARLLAKIYNRLGVLSKGQLVEVDRSGLVAGYIGQTALKVQEVIQKALGGILFIDEAYSLTANTSGNDYGHEAVETLLKAMEDNRSDLVVIVAGYSELMEQFLASNPGLRSRFNKFIVFNDYIPEELLNIFMTMCEKAEVEVNAECKAYVAKFFENRYQHRGKTFANGRDVRNFFEQAVVNQANRLVLQGSISNDDLTCLTYADVSKISM